MGFLFGRKKMADEDVKKEEAAAEQVAEEAVANPEAADATAESGAVEPEAAAEAKPAEGKPAEVDWKDQYARLMADFDNFKKRTARDRDDTYRYAEADILKDILPTVDNLALALSKAGNPDDPFVKGVQLVCDTLLNALKDHGAEPFDSVGKPLDIEKMEAVAQLPNEEVAEGLVSNEVKRGWTLKGKVLRAAQVVVSSGKPA